MPTAAPKPVNEVLLGHYRRVAAGRSIQKLREDMSKAGFAIGQGTLNRIARGDAGLHVKTLAKFAEYAGMEPHELLGQTAGTSLAQSRLLGHLDVDMLLLFQRLSPDHKDEVLALANRLYVLDNPEKSAANPFHKTPPPPTDKKSATKKAGA